jgi:hypothetical protein
LKNKKESLSIRQGLITGVSDAAGPEDISGNLACAGFV